MTNKKTEQSVNLKYLLFAKYLIKVLKSDQWSLVTFNHICGTLSNSCNSYYFL